MSSASKKLIQASAGQAGGEDFYPYTIENSCRFNGSDNAYLSKTFSTTPDSRTTCTISVWVKLTGKGNGYSVNFVWGTAGNWEQGSFIEPTNGNSWRSNQIRVTGMTSPQPTLRTTSVYRDYSGWFNFITVWDTSNAIAADRQRLYINGVRLTDFDQQVTASLNQELQEWLSTTGASNIGVGGGSTVQSFDGYMSDFVCLDGTAASPTDLGEDKNGVWVPKDPSGLTFGANGFYLDFADSANLGNDVSGNNNDFTSTGLATTDQMIDTPTNNFATLNPLFVSATAANTYSEGNLQVATGTTGGGNATSTMPIPSTGQWYFEMTPSAMGPGILLGLWQPDVAEDFGYHATPSIAYNSVSGNKHLDNVVTAYGATWTTSDVMGVAVDVDAGTVTFYKNNSSQGAITYDASGLFPVLVDGSGGSGATGLFDFGQGGFTYTPPADHLPLCTANMPEPTIGPNSTIKTDEVFAPILYTGNASARSIDVGFQPDFTWIKNRDVADGHTLFDAVRGATKYLSSNNTNVEATDANSLTAFDSVGFDLGTSPGINSNTEDYVAWNWKGNGSGVSNADGSITSTVSANQDAGVSIVTYTGSSSGISVGHGLSSAPEMLIFKARGTPNGSARNWIVWTKDLASTDYILYLSLTNAQTNVAAGSVLSSSPTATTFSLGTEPSVNWNAQDYVAYCFHSVEGMCKVDYYKGNGNADGPFIYTGFRPAYVVIKQTNAARDWRQHDAAREPYNFMYSFFDLNTADAEATTSTIERLDFLSNGFKIRAVSAGWNESGGTYIYMAFAENPFKYSNAR